MQKKFRDYLLKGFIEFSNKDTPLKPILQPLSIWPETNFMLEEFYSRPNINIGNDPKGLRIKNSMRHTVGSAREYKNNPALTEKLGISKERMDLLLQPLGYMWKNKNFNYPKYFKETVNDTAIDLQNNRIGRDFIKYNPKATDEDIMQYALIQALNNHDKQYNVTPLKKFQQQLLEDNRSL